MLGRECSRLDWSTFLARRPVVSNHAGRFFREMMMPVEAPVFDLQAWIEGRGGGTKLMVRLYRGQLDPQRLYALSEIPQAFFVGYEEQEFRPSHPPQFIRGRFAYAGSELLFWFDQTIEEHAEEIGGYYLVAVFPDGEEVLVIWEAFKEPQVMNTWGKSFGLVVYLNNWHVQL